MNKLKENPDWITVKEWKKKFESRLVDKYQERAKKQAGMSWPCYYWWSSKEIKPGAELAVELVYESMRIEDPYWDIDFQQFRRKLFKLRQPWKRYSVWTAGDRHQKPIIYNYKKKELSDLTLQKREWKKKVKDRRDQGQAHYNRKYETLSKRYGNKAERRTTKTKMRSGNWEAYPSRSSLYFETNRVCNGECCDHIPETWDYNYPENEWDTYLSRKKREWLDPWDWD